MTDSITPAADPPGGTPQCVDSTLAADPPGGTPQCVDSTLAASTSRRRPWRTAGFILLGIVCAALILHQPILTALGRYLVVSQPLQKTDCIVVLAGEGGERVREGVRLWKQGYAPVIIMSGGPSEAGVTLASLMRRQALDEGVPPAAILLQDRSRDTGEDAMYTAAMVRRLGCRSMLLVTSPYHTRRAFHLFRQALAGSGIQVICRAVPDSWFSPDQWWTRPRDRKIVIVEYMKMLWYAW